MPVPAIAAPKGSWAQRPGAARWSPLLVFGQTSLFVYWVHVEIVYGFVTYPIRHEFSIAGALVGARVTAPNILVADDGILRRTRGGVRFARRHRGPRCRDRVVELGAQVTV